MARCKLSLAKSRLAGASESRHERDRGMRRTCLYAAMTRDEVTRQMGVFQQPVRGVNRYAR
jgi:hypothetical protein